MGEAKQKKTATAKLVEQFPGCSLCGGERHATTRDHIPLLDAARKIDLFFWIDAEKGTLQHVSVNGAPHQATALDLLGLKNDDAP